MRGDVLKSLSTTARTSYIYTKGKEKEEVQQNETIFDDTRSTKE